MTEVDINTLTWTSHTSALRFWSSALMGITTFDRLFAKAQSQVDKLHIGVKLLFHVLPYSLAFTLLMRLLLTAEYTDISVFMGVVFFFSGLIAALVIPVGIGAFLGILVGIVGVIIEQFHGGILFSIKRIFLTSLAFSTALGSILSVRDLLAVAIVFGITGEILLGILLVSTFFVVRIISRWFEARAVTLIDDC